mmetsp:Transcript_5894/g.9106  ORF Transcript_5894/g.9106 Transcript_5894/m.9106 type:complete len:353 (-) Transcript_5894:150-1208(-)|eukprot:CAMPEP_0195309382 /NCGR_PEP_ID=MMETSP0707-20130614/38711_1 /TAXON_ID=33640 /ORGANISM="Asterionellopsis glacialis, Strain CCMP134" /LENGTH=352 /DNA_ID=CAMNT_0040373679 /DNA_START=161 /DNA_END=1219 /DNA_ORIENTATION=-
MTDISFPSHDGMVELYGRLSLPVAHQVQSSDISSSHQIPAIVIIQGSGPIDRDGNAPSMRLKLNTSNRFAEHILKRPDDRCMAVLSYDKRGVGKSTKDDDQNLYYRTGMMDLVLDAVEAVRYLASHPRIDQSKIVLLGHSEGAIIIPLVCREVATAELDPIFGCIFYSGFGETLENALLLQRETILADVQKETGLKGWLLQTLITEKRISEQHEDLMKKVNSDDKPDFISTYCGLSKQPAKWFREHFAYDASDALKQHITCHCLAITGCKDVQVHNEHCLPDKAPALVPLAASMEAHRPANLTHALRSVDGSPSILNIHSDYTRMGQLPLDSGLLSITDSWCDRSIFGIMDG